MRYCINIHPFRRMDEITKLLLRSIYDDSEIENHRNEKHVGTTNLLIFCSAIKTIENIFHEIKRNENYHSCAKYAGRQFQGAMRLVYKYGDAVFVREGMWQIMRLRARLYHSFGYEKILVPS